MPGENVDRRVKKTKRQLRLALMELMCEKPQKHISVRELADRLSEMCCLHARNTEIDSYPFLTDLYGFMLDNADICKVLLGINGDIAYRQRICGILHDDFLYDFLSRFYPENRQKLEYFCAFIVSGNLNLALTWLNEGAKESPEEMAQLAGEIIMKGVGFLR